MDSTRRRQLIGLAVALAVIVGLQYFADEPEEPDDIPYSEFLDHLESGRIETAEIRSDRIAAELSATEGKEPTKVVTERLPDVPTPELVAELRAAGVEFSGIIEETSWWQGFLLGWILPIGFLVLIYALVMRRIGRRGGPMSFGKSEAKIYDRSAEERATFADVAGVDEAEAELVEVVDFLKHPEKYRAIGARIPKGVLLVGPPGTGKTLLARAIAGEAEVPFFTISGSEFVEMFVGVGAARMRSLFEQAKERAPCIVFVDELDAIGKSRGGVGAMATHDEREQTLNQLLVEMDGFDPGTNVVIVAATNRPEVLDRALVRPGRFDRQVLVDRPDLQGRVEILEVHSHSIHIDDEVDLAVVARRTPGMVGADLANVVNEAAIAAARRGATRVGARDFENAIDRIQLGLEKRGRAMNDEERHRVAVHESGHALVALSVEHADPVHRVTIVPRSIGALGATLQLPTEERYLMTQAELLDRICVMLGGRAAEELVLGSVSTGAHNDLERATETARQMVCRFGMSSELGPQTFGRPVGSRFLESPVQMEERNFSEVTGQRIDAEVGEIVRTQHRRAAEVLAARRDALEAVAARLLDVETLDADVLEEVSGGRLGEALG